MENNLKKIQYRDMIIKTVKEEYGEIDEPRLIYRLNKATEDELERICDAINRFGVKLVFSSLN